MTAWATPHVIISLIKVGNVNENETYQHKKRDVVLCAWCI